MGTMCHVLLLGLDEPLQLSLSRLFEQKGYSTASEPDAATGESSIINNAPRWILMGENLPLVDDESIVTRIRNLTRAPIIVIGAGQGTIAVKALLDGADYYLPRPVDFKELLSRMRALSRREKGAFNPEPLRSLPH